MKGARRLPWAAVLWLVFAVLPGRAGADGPGDGLYGRYDAPFALALSAGGGMAWGDGRPDGTAAAAVRLRHLSAAGPFVAARWGPDAGSHVVAGVEVRPLFPLLFLQDLSTGHEFWDLLIQSAGLDLGVAVLPLDGDVGAGLALGLGLEVPVVLPSWWAGGVFVRFGVRRIWTPSGWRQSSDTDASEWTGLATLVVHLEVGDGPVLSEPPRYRP